MQVLIYHKTTEWISLKIIVTCFGGTPPSSGSFSAETCSSKLRNLFLCMLDVHLLVLCMRCSVTMYGMNTVKIVQHGVQRKLPLVPFLIHMTPFYVRLCLGLPKWLFLQGFQWVLNASSIAPSFIQTLYATYRYLTVTTDRSSISGKDTYFSVFFTSAAPHCPTQLHIQWASP